MRRCSTRSIAPYTIEEAYEVADAIDRGDLDAPQEVPLVVRSLCARDTTLTLHLDEDEGASGDHGRIVDHFPVPNVPAP